jgi:hypothetical protein
MLVLAGPVGLVEQEFGSRRAELVLRLAHRGERHRGIGGELDVVVADHGEIAGHRHPGQAQPPQQPEGQHVVGAERSGRRPPRRGSGPGDACLKSATG